MGFNEYPSLTNNWLGPERSVKSGDHCNDQNPSIHSQLNLISGPHRPVKCPLGDGFTSYITYGVTKAAPKPKPKPKRSRKKKKKKQQPSSTSTSPLGKSAIIFKIDKDHPEKSYTEHRMSTYPCFRSDIVQIIFFLK